MLPAAFSPHSNNADFTCAEGTGTRYSRGNASRAPSIASGNRPPSRDVNRAPDAANGSVTRRIGRLDSDSSPNSVVWNRWPATRPHNSRIVVPELPQSSGAFGSVRPNRPTPWT